jgi:hypothetical protein
MRRISTETLEREYGLPRRIANEILAEQRQRALRRHWQCWSLLLLPPIVAGAALFSPYRALALPFLTASVLWAQLSLHVADRYAEPGVRAAAREKADRLAGKRPPRGRTWPPWRI